MYLPTQDPAAGQWSLWDYQRKVVRSAAAAAGVMSAQLPAAPDNELWMIDRVLIQSTSSATTAAYLYLDLVDADHVIDGSWSGNFDTGDMASPHLVLPTQSLIARWTGATDGAIGRLHVQYTILRRPV